MRQSNIVARVAALVAAAVLASGVAWAGVVGVVSAVSKTTVTVSGAVYDVDGVAVEDMTGHPITWPEVRPGVTVELEFDEAGQLVTIRAAVVR